MGSGITVRIIGITVRIIGIPVRIIGITVRIIGIPVRIIGIPVQIIGIRIACAVWVGLGTHVRLRSEVESVDWSPVLSLNAV